MPNIHHSELTSNQYYGGLNRRFDARIRLLRKLNFSYDRETRCYYSKHEHYRRKKLNGIQLAMVMHSDRRAWRERLAGLVG